MKKEITLQFPLLAGGEGEGIHGSGIETFKGNEARNLARECGQNTLDVAKENGPARLEFKCEKWDTNSFPGLENFSDILESCKKYYFTEEVCIFTKKAQKMLEQEKIQTLIVTDDGTTGLIGGDSERDKNWYSLVRSGGVSTKGKGAGGSFGIGKFAPFTVSAFRTVYYTTQTSENKEDCAFQGVVRLISHKDRAGRETQGTGYIGYVDNSDPLAPEFTAVRNREDIPKHFRKDSQGTSLVIPGFTLGGNWREELVRSIIENFWLAVYADKIEFVVDETEITKDTIDDLIIQYENKESTENAAIYFSCLTSGETHEFNKEFDHIGKCKFYLLFDDEYPKQVAMTRKNRMIIDYFRFRGGSAFAGVFICEDNKGNEILRKMEPPRHDEWNPGRYDESEESRKLGSKIINDIRKWINNCRNEATPKIKGESFEDREIAKYFPDLVDDDEGFTEEEIFEQAPDPGTKRSRGDFLETKPKIYKPSVAIGPEQAAAESAEEQVSDYLQVIGDNTTNEGESPTGSKSRKKRTPRKRSSEIKCRFWEEEDGSYSLILIPDENISGNVELKAPGDDSEEQINIESAGEIDTGEELTIHHGYIKDVSFKKGEKKQFIVCIDSDARIALKVICHEN